jgi:hypothetical protein
LRAVSTVLLFFVFPCFARSRLRAAGPIAVAGRRARAETENAKADKGQNGQKKTKLKQQKMYLKQLWF